MAPSTNNKIDTIDTGHLHTWPPLGIMVGRWKLCQRSIGILRWAYVSMYLAAYRILRLSVIARERDMLGADGVHIQQGPYPLGLHQGTIDYAKMMQKYRYLHGMPGTTAAMMCPAKACPHVASYMVLTTSPSHVAETHLVCGHHWHNPTEILWKRYMRRTIVASDAWFTSAIDAPIILQASQRSRSSYS